MAYTCIPASTRHMEESELSLCRRVAGLGVSSARFDAVAVAAGVSPGLIILLGGGDNKVFLARNRAQLQTPNEPTLLSTDECSQQHMPIPDSMARNRGRLVNQEDSQRGPCRAFCMTW